MEINELWNYILSFTIYGGNEYIHYKIIATFFLIIGLILFIDGFSKPLLFRGGKVIEVSNNPQKSDKDSGIMQIFGGLAAMGFVVYPLLYVTFSYTVFLLLLELLKFLRKK